MSQLEDIRFKQADHERRIAALEALVNPLAGEMKEAAQMKAAAGAEDLLGEGEPSAPETTPVVDPPKDDVPPIDPPKTDEPNVPSVSGEVDAKEEPKDEAN